MKFFGGKIDKRSVALVLALVMLVSAMFIGCSQKSAQPAAQQPKEDDFPTKPIQNIVSWAPGGSSDMSQRLIGSFIGNYLGQSMIVVNKPGGAAVPGTTEIGKAKPDGYTVGMNWYASYVLRPYILEVPYKTEDYEFILGFMRQRNAIAVRSDSPFKTLDDLVKYAKENPNKLKFSGSPTASWQHLAGMHFNQVAGIETQFVPYDGGRPSAVALMGGHLDYIVGQPAEYKGELDAGQIRILAAVEKERISWLPDIPTAIELGYNVAHPHMAILVAPKGIPAERVKKIHDAYKAVLEDKDFLAMAEKSGLEIEYKSGVDVKKEIDELNTIYKDLVPKVLKK